ncbi:hypothetical protein Sru01_67850 [Sphaerisporangium rufum]|uniref:DNA topoisomerase (ATP-hydrolyzing) n=1 Tax=Sphaerisporangium rufum TaxID=1381558 RepID=A0A919R9R0_9ACTN|nr:hypothetical protein [Sphaerisporangium rufum]GII81803.1 hypothetical protein Sru01_67850 [Sphaerisporangium rufum]
MGIPQASWYNTTHDWARGVDADHLSRIRQYPARFAPGGVRHLILEVVAYAADEAESRDGGHCTVTLHPDGSVSVMDDGRGTDTRFDDRGLVVKKPVMASKDLRFFDHPDPPSLPDGHPRRGMSVVAALSGWLRHTNRRTNGSWTQEYARGIPRTGLVPVADDGTTGTVVHFRPDERLAVPAPDPVADLLGLGGRWGVLALRVDDRRSVP